MPWSGSSPNKSFSRTTGTYTGATAWAQEDAAGTRVVASKFDTHDQDLATGINTCLAKDGGNSPTADINWGGYKITNLADPTDAQHGATKAYVDTATAATTPADNSVSTAKIQDSAVTTAKVNNDAVTNAKLANMAVNTIKGRITSGTGDPEDLTATQATSLLNAVVGDSGSGGTKGLVPAPAAGDAAANKFLKANGAWAAVPAASPLVGYAEARSVITTGTTYSAGADIVTVAYAATSASSKLKITVDMRFRATTGSGGGTAVVEVLRNGTALYQIGSAAGGSVGLNINGEFHGSFMTTVPDTSSNTYQIRWRLASGNISSFLANADTLYSPLIIVEEFTT